MPADDTHHPDTRHPDTNHLNSSPAADPYAYRHERDSVKATAELLADRWTVLVLREAFFGVRRFGQMRRNLDIARTVLTARLKMLVAEGLLERRAYREDPVWFEYRLTEKGLDFYPVAVALMRWGDRYLAGPAGPPTVLHHRSCGQDTRPELICEHCREPVHARDIEARPGPGAYPATDDEPAGRTGRHGNASAAPDYA
jgi:DNA-binding HxlR family transcriptional regulator